MRNFVVGIVLNDDIVEIKFVKKSGNVKRESLIVSNMQGMVTRIKFSQSGKMTKKVLIHSQPSESVFFSFIEELRLFIDPRVVEIEVKKNLTTVKNRSLRRRSNSDSGGKRGRGINPPVLTIQIGEEYSSHVCYNASNSKVPSITLFIGTVNGKIYMINYFPKSKQGE